MFNISFFSSSSSWRVCVFVYARDVHASIHKTFYVFLFTFLLTLPQSHSVLMITPFTLLWLYTHPHTHRCTHIFMHMPACSVEDGGGERLIDRRRVSQRKADNYIFYGTFKGQTYIGVIGIFARQAPRYNAGRGGRNREGGARGRRFYISREIRRGGGDPSPFHR